MSKIEGEPREEPDKPFEIKSYQRHKSKEVVLYTAIPSCLGQVAIKEMLASMVPEGNKKGIVYVSADTGREVPIPSGQLRELGYWPREERRDMLNIMAMRIKASPLALIIETK